MAGSTTNIGLIKPTYSEDADVAIINENMDTLDSTISALDNGLAIVSNNNTHGAITAGQYVYVRNHGSLAEGMYTANSNIAANATLSSSNLTAVSSGSLNKLDSDIRTLNGKITNNYTDYNSNGNYHVRVTQLGKMVIVSGEVFGKGTEGYITDIALPTPFGYDGRTELLANAVIFYARNQITGAIQQMRTGADHYIYREAAMTNGQPYAFAFSYCKQ